MGWCRNVDVGEGLARIELATFRLGNGRSSVELQPREFEGPLGLEPRIYSLKDCCSTIELEAHIVFGTLGRTRTCNRLVRSQALFH